jgi:hypothetical protein
MSSIPFRPLAVVLRIFAAFAIITGVLDILTGTIPLTGGGAHLVPSTTTDAVLNSQIKFMGGIWCGYGVALGWTTFDLAKCRETLYILLGTLLLAGTGRLVSAIVYGAGPPLLSVFIVIEIAGSIAVFTSHRRLLARISLISQTRANGNGCVA